MRTLAFAVVLLSAPAHADRIELAANGGKDQLLFGGLAFASDGALYISGTFFERMTLGGKQLRAAKKGFRDGFVARVEKDGNVAWLVNAAGISDVSAIAAAPNGDVVVGGHHEYYIGKEQGPVTDWRSRAGVVRFDAKGKRSWHVEFPTLDRSRVEDVAVATDGSVVVAGGYADKTQFGQQALTSIAVKNAWGVTLPSFDVFVAKLRATDGHVEWVTAGGGGEHDIAESVAITPKGDIVVAGTIGPGVKFGKHALAGPVPYPQQQRLANPSWPFVVRYSPDGVLRWATQLPGHDHALMQDDGVVALDDESVLVYARDREMPGNGAADVDHPLLFHVRLDGKLAQRTIDEPDLLVPVGNAVLAARVTADALVFDEHAVTSSTRKASIPRRPDSTTSSSRKMGRYEIKPYSLVRAGDGRFAFAALVGTMTETPKGNRTIEVTFGSILPAIVISPKLEELLPAKAR